MSASSQFTFLIDIPFHSEWSNIDLLRSSVLNCFTVMFSDLDGSHQIAMVVGELLENAVKYGDWRPGNSPFRLRVWGDAHHASVAVENPATAGSEHFAALQETIRWIKSYASPEEAYRARLLQVAASADAGISRLGLARVAYAGNCTLAAEFHEGVVHVKAEMSLHPA